MNSIKFRLAYKLFILTFFVQSPLNLQNVFATPQSKIFSATHQNVTKGRVDPPSHLGRPLVRTGLAELPHPAPDSYARG